MKMVKIIIRIIKEFKIIINIKEKIIIINKKINI